MKKNIDYDVLNQVTYLIGSKSVVMKSLSVPAKPPFSDDIIDFLNNVSREIMRDPRSREYSDVITLGFWIRKGSTLNLKERFEQNDNSVHLGKGLVFHIAPSNVPVNFAYSLVCGLLCGNTNIVRVPSKEFPQIAILVDAFNSVLAKNENMKAYITLVRYEHNKDINDLFSAISDLRVVWGGNETITELRKSELQPRSGEVTFADRYSLAVIDSDFYLDLEDKGRVAEDFYNDTFFSDQNACTSPRIVIWTGRKIEEAKKLFWNKEHKVVEKKYHYQAIQGVNKLIKCYLFAVDNPGAKIEEHLDNLIIRVKVQQLTDELMDYKDNSGYFYEYDCENIMDIVPICNDKRCQTIAYIGDSKVFLPLIQSGIKGIDRIVPMGKTMDFDLLWDGYNLPAFFTRTIVLL